MMLLDDSRVGGLNLFKLECRIGYGYQGMFGNIQQDLRRILHHLGCAFSVSV
jgi:hypothetical protein